MLINLFEKGEGLLYLQRLYSLDQDEVYWIQDNLFDYDCELTTREEALRIIHLMRKQGEESEDSLDRTLQFILDRNRHNRWVKDDAEDLFLNRFGEREYSDVQFTLKHITTAIDGGASIRKQGLLKLTTLLETESPLKSFLAEEGILFDLSREIIKLNGETHSLQEYRFGEIRGKLIRYRGDIEGFIIGEMDRMKRYSNIQNCPEILISLDRALGNDNEKKLQEKWCQKRTDKFCIQFDADISEFTISECPLAGNEQLNRWTIRMCLQNMCKNQMLPERYIALKDCIESHRLKMIELDSI